MKIISWNVKGLGRPRKNFSIKEVLKKYKADIVMIQETKNQKIDKTMFPIIWGRKI